MKVQGTELRLAIQRCIERASMAKDQFPESLWAFPDDENQVPLDIYQEYVDASEGVALLQVAQQAFNRLTKVQVNGVEMPLALAVNLVGGAGTRAKMLRAAQRDKGRDRWSVPEKTRDANVVVAKRQLSVADATEQLKLAAMYASKLRQAIAMGNATTCELTPENTGFRLGQLMQIQSLLHT